MTPQSNDVRRLAFCHGFDKLPLVFLYDWNLASLAGLLHGHNIEYVTDPRSLTIADGLILPEFFSSRAPLLCLFSPLFFLLLKILAYRDIE